MRYGRARIAKRRSDKKNPTPWDTGPGDLGFPNRPELPQGR